MVKSPLYFMFALLLMTLTNMAQAAGSASEKLTIFVQSVVTFEAKFEQTVLSAGGDIIEQAEGQFLLERPGRFRWDYFQPYVQHIVADGQRIWFYDVDLEQVTVKSQQEALSDTPATLLSGDMLPEEKYIVRDVASDDGYQWVELIPKESESSFQAVRFAFDNEGLKRMVMRDNFDQYTRLVFSDVVENNEIAQEAFIFTAPEGVDVVGDVAQ